MKPIASDDAFGLCLLAALLADLAVLAFADIPDKNLELFTAISSGVLGSSFMAWINYRWGSSRGSAGKDATIAAMATDTPAPDPTKAP